jgi:hypothetical protein
MNTYSRLNNDVTDGSVVKGLGRCRSLGVSDSSKNNALIEVDSVVSDVTGIVSCAIGLLP